jgi:hypothetical protein
MVKYLAQGAFELVNHFEIGNWVNKLSTKDNHVTIFLLLLLLLLAAHIWDDRFSEQLASDERRFFNDFYLSFFLSFTS